jgi:SAM-dependent methyltransferase
MPSTSPFASVARRSRGGARGRLRHGELRERVAGETSAEVVATDLSPRMVEIARERGLDARVADVQELRFGSDEFDCAVCERDALPRRGSRSCAHRADACARAGWRLVAVTIGAEHMASSGSWSATVARAAVLARERGGQLGRHFREVRRQDVDAELVFPDSSPSTTTSSRPSSATRCLGRFPTSRAVPLRACVRRSSWRKR